MELSDILQNLMLFGQAAIAIGGAIGLGYAICRYNLRLDSFGEKLAIRREATRKTSVPITARKTEEGAQLRNVKEAICFGPGTRSVIKGTVDFWTPASDGYVGTLRDDSGQAPFYVSDENLDPYDGKWVVPVLLEHSRRNQQQPIKMEVESPDGLPILIVRGVHYEIDGQKYDI